MGSAGRPADRGLARARGRRARADRRPVGRGARPGRDLLADGSALDRFRAFVTAQGGDATVVDDPRAVLPVAPVTATWVPEEGSVQGFACRRLGELAGRLGAGRLRQGDTLDLAVGLEVHVRTGDRVDGRARR